MPKKRNLLDELNEGFAALAEQRGGKRRPRARTGKTKAARKVITRKVKALR
jgi:hypothetical protein